MFQALRNPVAHLALERLRVELSNVVLVFQKPQLQLLQDELQECELCAQVLRGVDKEEVEKCVAEDRHEHVPGQDDEEELVGGGLVLVEGKTDGSW